MRKIVSFCIGAALSGWRTPRASKYATLPRRATSATAPGTRPRSISARSVSVNRARRARERPTSSGAAKGRDVDMAGLSPLAQDCRVNHVAEERAVVHALARRLHHEHHEHVLLGIDP